MELKIDNYIEVDVVVFYDFIRSYNQRINIRVGEFISVEALLFYEGENIFAISTIKKKNVSLRFFVEKEEFEKYKKRRF